MSLWPACIGIIQVQFGTAMLLLSLSYSSGQSVYSCTVAIAEHCSTDRTVMISQPACVNVKGINYLCNARIMLYVAQSQRYCPLTWSCVRLIHNLMKLQIIHKRNSMASLQWRNRPWAYAAPRDAYAGESKSSTHKTVYSITCQCNS